MKLTDAITGTKAFIQAWRKDVVSPETILERSNTCKVCPVRTKSIAAGILKSIIDKNGVSSELADYKCGICKCPLLNLIVAKEVHQDSTKERERRIKKNKNCWMLNL